MCPTCEHHGSPVAKDSPALGGRELVHPGVRWRITLCPAWCWVAFRHVGWCGFIEPCPCSWVWEGSRGKGQWEEKEKDDALDIKLLEPAPRG